MIDEELYQQAADELNSDRRRPHIWARACALASDDHDEARFLYTNLRVEELLEERENQANRGSLSDSPTIDTDATLALVDDVGSDANDMNDFLQELKPDLDDGDGGESIPESVPVPAGKDRPESADGFLSLEPLEDETPSVDTSAQALPDEPDADLMADYVPEVLDPLDDTYAGEGLAEDEFEKELASFKAEERELANTPQANTAAEQTDDIQAQTDSLGIETADFTDALPDIDSDAPPDTQASISRDFQANSQPTDLTQANLNVLDAHANELDEMLGDTGYEPPKEAEAELDMQWLEDESSSQDEEPRPAHTHDPVIYDDDPFTEELGRQADELDLGPSADQTADFSQQILHELSEDEKFPESVADQVVETDREPPGETASGHAQDSEQSASEAEAGNVGPVVAASTVAAAASASTLSSSTRSHERTGIGEDYDELDDASAPLDLTRGRKGKLFSVYRRNNEAQAVRSGVSWPALFFTLPYLLYRQLFATAFAYVLLWIVAMGGLVLSGLAWLDAGASVTPLIQACTIGFALLVFIGLFYLPFRYGNTWRSERLENSGFELVAIAKASNPGRAIARARRHMALDS